MTPASRMQAAMKTFNPELWPCWNKHSSCRTRVGGRIIQECNRDTIKPHPVVGIVCKEIPILKLLFELLVDFFRVLIQILG